MSFKLFVMLWKFCWFLAQLSNAPSGTLNWEALTFFLYVQIASNEGYYNKNNICILCIISLQVQGKKNIQGTMLSWINVMLKSWSEFIFKILYERCQLISIVISNVKGNGCAGSRLCAERMSPKLNPFSVICGLLFAYLLLRMWCSTRITLKTLYLLSAK